MNRQELERIRKKNMEKLDGAYRLNINRIEYSPSESIDHFMAKTICFILLRNGVPATELKEIIDFDISSLHWTSLDWGLEPYLKQKFNHDWERPQIVCEARTIKEGKWDLFNLDTGERIEIVDTSEDAEKPYDENTVVVRI